MIPTVSILVGDALEKLRELPNESVQCCVTSPPYVARLAYCGGVIDSDGTIGIKRNTYAMRVRQDCEQPTYSERICVKQVTGEAIAVLVKTFGGCVYQSTPKVGRTLIVWQITDKKAAQAISQLIPFLRIKKEQALNCWALRGLKEKSKIDRVRPGRGHVGGTRRNAEISRKMEELYLRAKALNNGKGVLQEC